MLSKKNPSALALGKDRGGQGDAPPEKSNSG